MPLCGFATRCFAGPGLGKCGGVDMCNAQVTLLCGRVPQVRARVGHEPSRNGLEALRTFESQPSSALALVSQGSCPRHVEAVPEELGTGADVGSQGLHMALSDIHDRRVLQVWCKYVQVQRRNGLRQNTWLKLLCVW